MGESYIGTIVSNSIIKSVICLNLWSSVGLPYVVRILYKEDERSSLWLIRSTCALKRSMCFSWRPCELI